MNQDVLLPVIPSQLPSYCCPGEHHPISRSLHLARLAAGHAACRDCSHRGEVAGLPSQVVKRTQSRLDRTTTPLISTEGIRGLYINQLTRERMGEIVQHVLERIETARVSDAEIPARGPLRILTGYDSRPTSPDLAIGMVSVMRKWGCVIADMGVTTRSAFEFAIDRFRPHAGLFLTGGNRGSAWNGLDIIDQDGLPWTFPGELTDLESRLGGIANRIGRSQGLYQTVDIRPEYESRLALLFHALRPLRMAIVCSDPLVRSTLKRQLEESPCSVHFLNATAGSIDETERARKSLIDTLCERRLDVGFLIGADGCSCQVFDEGGYELSPLDTLKLVLQADDSQFDEASRHRHITTAASTSTPHPAPAAIAGVMLVEHSPVNPVPEIQIISGTLVDLLRVQRSQRIPVAVDSDHRYWFLGEQPACDALQTLAKVLEVLSQQDRPTSAYRTMASTGSRSRH